MKGHGKMIRGRGKASVYTQMVACMKVTGMQTKESMESVCMLMGVCMKESLLMTRSMSSEGACPAKVRLRCRRCA